MEKCDREIKSESEFYCKNMESSGVYWNNKIDLSALDFNDARYICLVIDPQTKFRSQSDNPSYDNLCIREVIYIDDVKYEGEYNENAWYIFSNYILDECDGWQIGRAHMGNYDLWHYLKGECYSLRFYREALTEEQVKENKKKTEDYHEILVSEE